jgi:hypothetical protein
MRLQYLILHLGLLFCTANLFAQNMDLDTLYQLPAAIRSNLVLIVTNAQPCAKELTNVLSNKHLFTKHEQQILKDIAVRHQNTPTNDIAYRCEFSRVRMGDGYNVYFDGPAIKSFMQFRGNQANGLYVQMTNDHCISWTRLKMGKVAGKWYKWDDAGNLTLEVEFKKPSDCLTNFVFTVTE